MTFWEYTSTDFAWLLTKPACLLCGDTRMNGDQLPGCTRLDEYPTDDVVSRYWEARRQMVKKPSTGFG
ncbi:hypothetical protein TNCV_1675151 [Trichonephila clavipes]|nr:hypothetical protein TNCV_1675151 [Trichonephila clavipes]